MAFLVFGVLIALVALTLIVIGPQKIDEGSRDELTLPLRGIGIGLALVAGLFFLFSSIYTQDPGEAILIRSAGGSIKNVDTNSGFGLTAPWNKRTKFDVRNQRIEMFTNDGGEGEDGAAISSPTKEGTNVGVSVTVRYSIESTRECITGIYNQYRSEGNLRDRALKPGLRDEVRIATAKYSAFEIKQRRGELTTDIVTALTERWDNDKLCISVDDVDLGDLLLDETTEDALKRINERQAEVEAARSDLERAQVEAEVTKTEAQADADADQIVRCGARATTETREVAGQETQVAVITPKTGAECENRLNEQVLINNYIEALEKLGEQGNLIVVPNAPDGGTILQLPAKAN